MRLVRLDDDRAAGRECGGGVAARDRKGEREIAGAEHGDRADGDGAQAQVDARQRLAVRHRGIDAQIEEPALAQHRGEQAQLAGGAGAFALDARARQAGLAHAAQDQRVAEIHDVLRDALQEGGAGGERGLAIGIERGPGGSTGRLELDLRCAAEGRLDRLSAGRIDPAQHTLRATLGNARDIHGAGDRSCGVVCGGGHAASLNLMRLPGHMHPRAPDGKHSGRYLTTGAHGSQTLKRLLLPSVLSICRRPAWRPTMCLTMASPRPLPALPLLPSSTR